MNKILKTIGLVILLILPNFSTELHDRFLHSHKESVVRLVSPKGGSGTGFVIKVKNKKYILTNKHVCMMNKGGDLSALDQRGGDRIVKVLVASKHYDLCLMTSRQDLPNLKFARSYEIFDNAAVLGHPLGLPITLEKGRLVSREVIQLRVSCNEKYDERKEVKGFLRLILGIDAICIKNFNSIRSNAAIYKGNSGSPMLNIWGNVNGVVFAGSTEADHVGYLVPLEDVKRFLGSINFR